MLVLGRKVGEKILITLGDTTVAVYIHKIQGSRVTVSIDAPRDISVVRGELISKETA